LRLRVRYELPVLAAVVVLRPGGVMRDYWEMGVGPQPTLRCQFRLIRLWQASVQEVIAPRRVGLYPLLPVMDWGSTPGEVGLALSRRLIEEQVPPGEARQDAMATLRVFARTAHPVEVVDRILGRGPEMIDSPVFADFIEEGRALGRQEGRLEGLRDDILAVLEARFGPVPAALATQVEQLADLARASAHFRRAVVVESLETFAQELAAARFGPG
jgi:predicted transposase YdaD